METVLVAGFRQIRAIEKDGRFGLTDNKFEYCLS